MFAAPTTARRNPYEIAGRFQKAMKLTETLIECGITADLMAPAGDAEWQMAAHCAGVRPPSYETRNLVMDWLRRNECKEARS